MSTKKLKAREINESVSFLVDKNGNENEKRM
jgi:hypothetical protein